MLLLLFSLLLSMAGIIVAEDEVTAKHAAHLVEVEYEDLEPIFSIEDAVAKQSFFPLEKKVRHVLPVAPALNGTSLVLLLVVDPLVVCISRSKRATWPRDWPSPRMLSRAACASVHFIFSHSFLAPQTRSYPALDSIRWPGTFLL